MKTIINKICEEITIINKICEEITIKTEPFASSKAGKLFLMLVLIGPLTFIPTMYEALTAPNIEALKTWTWPLMTIANASGLYGNIRKGDWRLCLVMFNWVIIMAIMSIITLMR